MPGLAEGPFKESEKLRLIELQEDVEHVIFMRAGAVDYNAIGMPDDVV